MPALRLTTISHKPLPIQHSEQFLYLYRNREALTIDIIELLFYNGSII